jgi:hypothetical protein
VASTNCCKTKGAAPLVRWWTPSRGASRWAQRFAVVVRIPRFDLKRSQSYAQMHVIHEHDVRSFESGSDCVYGIGRHGASASLEIHDRR